MRITRDLSWIVVDFMMYACHLPSFVEVKQCFVAITLLTPPRRSDDVLRAPTKTLDLGWGLKTAILREKA
jgi:hypothetical protein